MKEKRSIELVIIIILLIIAIFNNYCPFLNTSIYDDLDKKKTNENKVKVSEHTKDRIRQLEEQSLIDVNSELGGIDEVNGNNKIIGNLKRRNINLQENDLGKKVFEEFSDDSVVVYTKPNCGLSQYYNDHINNELFKLFKNNHIDFDHVHSANTQPLIKSVQEYLEKYSNIGSDFSLKYPIIIYQDKLITGNEIFHSGNILNANQIYNLLTSEDFGNVIEGFSSREASQQKAKCPSIFKSKEFDHIGELFDIHKDKLEGLKGKKKVITNGEVTYNYDDIDSDGCVKANFDICDSNSDRPGFSVFTNRGQYGCSKPDPNANLDSYSAAFSVFDTYLSSIPPEQDKINGGDKIYDKEDCDENEKIAKKKRKEQMKKCALKHANHIYSFGLCDNPEKLQSHINASKNIQEGRGKAYFDMNHEDYAASAEVADVIKDVCGF